MRVQSTCQVAQATRPPARRFYGLPSELQDAIITDDPRLWLRSDSKDPFEITAPPTKLTCISMAVGMRTLFIHRTGLRSKPAEFSMARHQFSP